MRGRLPSFRRSKQAPPAGADGTGTPAPPAPDAAPDDQPTQAFEAADLARAAAAPARPGDAPAPGAQPTAEQAPPPPVSPEAWAPATGVGGATPPPVAPIAQPPADLDPAAMEVASAPSFRDRGRLRRRLSYLRRVRELGFRDLGGLVFDLHRFNHQGAELVQAKLNALDVVDRELRALERVLRDKPLYVDLREPGIAACPRCAALHGSDARFCPSCGMRLAGPLSMGDLGAAPAGAPQPVPAPPAGAPQPGAPVWPNGAPPGPGLAPGVAAAAAAPTQQLPAVPPPSEQPTQVATAVGAAAVAPSPVAAPADAPGPVLQQDGPLKEHGDKLAEPSGDDAATPAADDPPAPGSGEDPDAPVPADEPAKTHGDPLTGS